MSGLIAFPVLILLMILQTTVVREINLLHGSADILLVWLCAWTLREDSQEKWIWIAVACALMVYFSAVPWFAVILGYLVIIILAKQIYQRLWQSPLISTFILVMASSITFYMVSYIGLQTGTNAYPFRETLIQVIIPSILLNLLFSIPVYVFARDVFQWTHPLKEI